MIRNNVIKATQTNLKPPMQLMHATKTTPTTNQA